MVTVYQIPCSCGCGALINRSIYASGACKMRGLRGKAKGDFQVIKVDSGEVVQDIAVKAIKTTEIITPASEFKGLGLLNKSSTMVIPKNNPGGFEPPVNLSKAHFARRRKGGPK